MQATHKDVSIAHRALLYAEGLSLADRRVAAAILFHFNLQTGRCDPGLDRLAALLGLDVRTVKRAIKRLDREEMIKCHRHRGRFGCNLYKPVWTTFAAMEAGWKANAKLISQGQDGRDLSSTIGQTSVPTGGEEVPQTICMNHLKEPVGPTTGGAAENPQKPVGRTTQGERYSKQAFHSPYSNRTASTAAATNAAERRWSSDLHALVGSDECLHALVIDALSTELQGRATEAEIRRRGSGILLLVDELDLPRQPQTRVPAALSVEIREETLEAGQ